MKHIHVVEPYHSIAMLRMAEPLVAELPKLYNITKSETVDPDADLNLHMPWHTLAGLSDRGMGKHVIAYTHCNPPDGLALIDACERADMITAMSFAGRDELLGLGVDPRKIWVNYCAADQFVYRRRNVAVTGFPQPNGRKREHLLLDLAWQYDLSPYQIVLVGSGWERINEQLNTLGVASVCFHADTDEQLQALYRTVDVLLVTGYAEGGPLPLLEALASGVRVLSPKFGYAADLLDDDALYETADELMEKLNDMTEQSIRRHKLVRAWSWVDYVREYALLFGRLLGESVDLHPEFGASRYAQLLDIIDEIHPRHLVEVGTWKGDRAIQMIQQASKYRPTEDITYTGFDLFEMQTGADLRRELSKPGWDLNVVLKRIQATGARVKLVPGYTRNTLEALYEYDLCFVDGGHSEETIEHDGRAVLAGLTPGAVVVFDDYYHAGRPDGCGCNKFIDGLDRNKYEITHMPNRTHAQDGREIGMVKVRLNADIRVQMPNETHAGGMAYSLPSYS